MYFQKYFSWDNNWFIFVLIFVMDIGKYFHRRNKKRDLSDQSKATEDPKKQHEKNARICPV